MDLKYNNIIKEEWVILIGMLFRVKCTELRYGTSTRALIRHLVLSTGYFIDNLFL